MTKSEALTIVTQIKYGFPSVYSRFSDKELEFMANDWQRQFSDVPFQMVQAGLDAYRNTEDSGFPPSVGQVRECMQKLDPVNEMTVDEAWALVKKATSNGIYGAEDEFEKLPEICQKVLVSPSRLRNMAMLDSEQSKEVEKSSFYSSYKTILKREKENAKIPPKVRELISDTLKKSETKQIAG